MKTYFRLVNTADGELPVVGDEVMGDLLEPGWHTVTEGNLPSVIFHQKYFIIRRELHTKDLLKAITDTMEDRHGLRRSAVKDAIWPHIQAALEGKP